ncbi:hypothetical protein ABU162_25390 [Paenibacillus thiaminolyticus]|uniref:hypothetical protein n=1 Tax=Paenibacillus thiaminolyticus TaxID=49283 RepID=UPI0035A65536
MKKLLIGSVILFNGTMICLTLIILAALYSSSIDTWRGTKFWFAIFGATDISNAQSLFLGVPFVIGLMLFFFGLLVLIIEYFKKNN